MELTSHRDSVNTAANLDVLGVDFHIPQCSKAHKGIVWLEGKQARLFLSGSSHNASSANPRESYFWQSVF